MAEVLFYHLTAGPIDATLPDLLEKSLARGWRVLVRCGTEGGVAFLDDALWTYRDDSFLPHGTASGGRAGDLPVLLTTGAENANRADVLMLAFGARVDVAEAADFVRMCLLFEGADAAAVEAAREDWRQVAGSGIPATYWAQEGGRWVRKAQSAGASA